MFASSLLPRARNTIVWFSFLVMLSQESLLISSHTSRLYLTSGGGITEVLIIDAGDRLVPMLGLRFKLLPEVLKVGRCVHDLIIYPSVAMKMTRARVGSIRIKYLVTGRTKN